MARPTPESSYFPKVNTDGAPIVRGQKYQISIPPDLDSRYACMGKGQKSYKPEDQLNQECGNRPRLLDKKPTSILAPKHLSRIFPKTVRFPNRDVQEG